MSDLTVAELGEQALIARIRALVPSDPAWVLVGIGDDAAVVEPERNCVDVVTTDALVEGVHFDRRFSTAADIGHKALAVNLSDLAAMAARPRVAVLSLGLPADTPVGEVEALVGSLVALATEHRLALVGGNITRSLQHLFVDVTAIGSARRRRVLTRSGARAGDEVYVSGSIGAAAAGLESLRQRIDGAPGAVMENADASFMSCETRYRRPVPRLRLGTLLGRNRAATACMDLSDGLADAVNQIAAASKVGITIAGDAVPIDPAARSWFERQGRDPLEAALSGGEDYELLFTVPKKARGRFRGVKRLIGDLAVTKVGVVTAEPIVVVERGGQQSPLPGGFVHF